MSLESFTERMQTGRDIAAGKRYKGQSTGKSAKGWNRKPSDVRPPDDWREMVSIMLELELAVAVNDVNYEFHGPMFEGCSDIPF